MTALAFKLLRVRADGSIGPLFINKRQRIRTGVWYQAEDHPTKGYAHRPGWHALRAPDAPHLSKAGRRWYVVLLDEATLHIRPRAQGGAWYLAEQMLVLAPYVPEKHNDLFPWVDFSKIGNQT